MMKNLEEHEFMFQQESNLNSTYLHHTKNNQIEHLQVDIRLCQQKINSKTTSAFRGDIFGIFGDLNFKNEYDLFSGKLEKIAQPIKLEIGKNLSDEELIKIVLENPDVDYLFLLRNQLTRLPKEIGQLSLF